VKRGDIFTVSMSGQTGKPRPALVVQNSLFLPGTSVALCPLTSDPIGSGYLRPAIEPNDLNNLKHPSWVMIDKIAAVEMQQIGKWIGLLALEQMRLVDQRLALFLGLQGS
jgi:mRNA interferase MazF